MFQAYFTKENLRCADGDPKTLRTQLAILLRVLTLSGNLSTR